MEKINLRLLIEKISTEHELDPLLCVAIAMVETGLDSYRVRYEPTWSYLMAPDHYAVSLGITLATEKILQSMSWGAMQCMGSTARSWGYQGMLTALVDPNLSILYACKYLQHLSLIYSNPSDVISSYNQGAPRRSPTGQYANQGYVDRVASAMSKLTTGNQT